MKNRISSERGFTLIEIIMAIVLIGIAVPAIMIPFSSGVSGTKNPEYIVQGSFMAQKRVEELAMEDRTSILTACPVGSTATAPAENGYEVDCTSISVNGDDPDVVNATSTFAQKITLTVRRTDGAMSSLEFNTLVVTEP